MTTVQTLESKQTETLPKLRPITSEWMKELARKPELLKELTSKFGSPVNIHSLLNFEENRSAFKAVFEEYGLRNRIFYARKANKSRAFVKRAGEIGAGVDTASFRELEESLELGLPSERLVCTAAIKNEELIKLAVENEVIVILDNEDECQITQKVAEELGKKARVGVRISGFKHKGKKLYSRFGFDIDVAENFITEQFGKSNQYKDLVYCGLHFHLNGYSTAERGTAILQSVELAKKLKSNGFRTDFLDIGGGILINYLESKKEWQEFKNRLKDCISGESKPITFNNDGLGFYLLNEKVRGKLATYPYFNELNTTNFLREVLDFENEAGKSASQLLKEENIEIRMEPGRSLLNQAGVTLAKVAFRKQDSRGDWLIGLEMNMSQMQSSSADFLLDPMVIYNNPNPEAEPIEAYFTGAYCLERDILLKRKIALPQKPEIGDFVIFVNTAGYMMHFFETQAHLFNLSENLAISKNSGFELEDFVQDKLIR